MDQEETWRRSRPCLPPKKKGRSPFTFGPCLLWPNCWMDEDATLYGGRPRRLGPDHIALDGDPAPTQYRGTAHPIFGPYICCGETAVRIKMTLGIGLGPGHIVLDGNPASPKPKGAHSPNFRPICLLWSNGRPSQLLLSSEYLRYDTIRWTILTCAQKLTSSQSNLRPTRNQNKKQPGIQRVQACTR